MEGGGGRNCWQNSAFYWRLTLDRLTTHTELDIVHWEMKIGIHFVILRQSSLTFDLWPIQTQKLHLWYKFSDPSSKLKKFTETTDYSAHADDRCTDGQTGTFLCPSIRKEGDKQTYLIDRARDHNFKLHQDVECGGVKVYQIQECQVVVDCIEKRRDEIQNKNCKEKIQCTNRFCVYM